MLRNVALSTDTRLSWVSYASAWIRRELGDASRVVDIPNKKGAERERGRGSEKEDRKKGEKKRKIDGERKGRTSESKESKGGGGVESGRDKRERKERQINKIIFTLISRLCSESFQRFSITVQELTTANTSFSFNHYRSLKKALFSHITDIRSLRKIIYHLCLSSSSPSASTLSPHPPPTPYRTVMTKLSDTLCK